ncbi:MAG: WYL domain-containing transcriptional regulator [Mariniphaga sp.]|nr:WYL domain-containing transcriptional regulator [Mariniphaga sp.]
MEDHAKLERMIRMLLMLSGQVTYTAPELAERFSTSERSIMRHLSTFRKVGFVVECAQGRYCIPKIQKPFKAINELLHFSEEEAHVLSKAIYTIDDNNLLKTNLINKLYALYDFDRVVETVVRREHSETVHGLISAIKGKKQVLLRQYRSSNGNIVRDRMVEPYGFTANYIYVWAFDPESDVCKLFKIARIESVEVLERPWQHEPLHQKMMIDVFRISKPEQTTVKLRLSLRAYNLIMEEYPLSEKYLTPLADNYWHFVAPVCGFEGVGRFVSGLCDEVYIEEPEALKTFIRNKIKRIKII